MSNEAVHAAIRYSVDHPKRNLWMLALVTLARAGLPPCGLARAGGIVAA
jgi:hypothetical protein